MIYVYIGRNIVKSINKKRERLGREKTRERERERERDCAYKSFTQVRTRLEKGIEKLGGGVKIINLVIPKPEIPQDIANNYKQVEEQYNKEVIAILYF